MTRFIATSALVAVVYVAAVCGQDILLGGWKSGGAAKQQSAASAASASNRPEPVKRTDSGDDYLASSPMLSLALNLDRCKSSSSRDCSTGNSVFSPLSIASTLTMLLTGTNGTSYNQLRKALGYAAGLDENQINSAYKHIMSRMKTLDSQHGQAIDLHVANGLFTRSDLVDEFVNKAKSYFSSDVYQFGLQRSPSMPSAINQWVASKTNNRIRNIVGSLSPDTQMIAANVVYLNANWADPFQPDYTSLQDFHVSPTETIQVAMMSEIGDVYYVDDKDLGLKMIGKPYVGEQLAMYLIVPTDTPGVDSLNSLEARLSDVIVNDLMERMTGRAVSVQLPKFRIHQKLSLKNPLRDLGVQALFSPNDADLSRMTSKSGVAFDDIVHQTFIEVTESGTEAAAATLASLTRFGPTRSFQANQPFMFFIMDVPTRSVLFSGRVTRPEFS